MAAKELDPFGSVLHDIYQREQNVGDLQNIRHQGTQTFADWFQEQEQIAARTALWNAHQQNPDQIAKADVLARQSGLPTDVVAKNMSLVDRDLKAKMQADTLRSSPFFTQWLQDNVNAQISHDQFQQMGYLEKMAKEYTGNSIVGAFARTLDRTGTAFSSGVESATTARAAGFERLYGDAKRARELLERSEKPFGGEDNLFYNMVNSVANIGADLTERAIRAQDKAVVMGTAAAAIGAAATPEFGGAGGAPLAVGGYLVGLTSGMYMDWAQSGTGRQLINLDRTEERAGVKFNPIAKWGFAMIGGNIEAGLNTFLGKELGVASEGIATAATKMLVDKVMIEAAERPTIRTAMTAFGKRMASVPLEATAFAVASTANQVLVDSGVRMMSPGQFKSLLDDPERMDQYAKQFADTLEGAMMLLGTAKGLHAATSAVYDISRIRQAKNDEAFLRAISDGSADNLVRERSPTRFGKFWAATLDGHPAENMYISGEKIRELYQSHGIEPGAEGDPFGFVPDMKDQLDQASLTGGDVVIKTADYAAHLAGSDIAKAIEPDVKFRPDALSAREAKSAYDNMDEVTRNAAAQIHAVLREGGEAREPVQKVAEEVYSQLVNAGHPVEQAQATASLWAMRYNQRAEELTKGGAQTNAYDLFKQEGVRFQRVLPGEVQARKVTGLDLMINGLRRRGEQGAAEDGAAPFQNVVHDKNLVVGAANAEAGDHLAEAGYAYRSLSPAEISSIRERGEALPNPSGKSKGGRKNVKHWSKADGKLYYRADQDVIRVREDMLDPGKPVRAEDIEVWNKETGQFEPIGRTEAAPKSEFDAHLDELADALDSIGVDVTKMSNDQIRQALEAAFGEEPAVENGFDQRGGTPHEDTTIEVDGQRRTVFNSNGQRLAYTKEGLEAFWRWFGDSEAVDETGQPIVMYTGTSKDKDFQHINVPRNGAWFSEDPSIASEYALDNDSKDLKYDPSKGPYGGYVEVNTASRVFPVYLKIENAKVFEGRELSDETYARGGDNYKRGQGILFDELRAQGFDGVHDNGIWVALKDSAQVKGLFNRGSFDPANKKLLFQTVREGKIRRTIDELVAAAESQSDWRNWYERHEQTIVDLFGQDADLFQKILSATSQAASVKANVGLAFKAYDQLFSGEPFTGYLPAVIKNLERIRADEDLAGAKISQYGKANEGDKDAIAVDRHIAMLFFNTKTPNAKQIASAKKRITVIAERLGWEPRQVQAALWAFNQVRLGTDPAQVISYDKVLEARADTIAALRTKHGRGEDGSLSTAGGSPEGNLEGQRGLRTEAGLTTRQFFQTVDSEANEVRALAEQDGGKVEDVVQVDDLINMKDVPVLTMADLVGMKIFPTISDRTAAAAIYEGIDSAGAAKKVAMLGGPLFPLRKTNLENGVVWANRGKAVTGNKGKKLENGATHMMVVMGDADMHQSNTTVTSAFISTLEAYIRQGRIAPESREGLAELIRTPAEPKVDKDTGEIKEKSDKVVAIEKKLAEFPGFEDIDAFEKFVDGLSFEARKRLLKIMGTKTAQDLGAPSMQRILDATREPSMAGHRWGDGVLIVKLDQDKPFVTLGKEGTMPHPDFPLGIRGEVVGRMKTPVNYETLWGDWLKQAYDDAVSRGTAEEKINVRRAFELAKPVVEVTPELAERIGKIETSDIDSARQARLAIDFAADNWRTSGVAVNKGGVSVQEYIDAINNSPAKAVLSEYTADEVKAAIKAKKMRVFQLGNDGQIFFALKKGDPGYAADYGIETPGITDNEVMLTSVVNNEQGARGVGGDSVVIKALAEGATVLDCFAVKNDKFLDGFLPTLYSKFGFEKVAEVPFDPQYYSPEKLADAVRYWKESTPGYDPETHGYPPLVIMKWKGTDAERAGIVDRYVRGDAEGLFARGVDEDVTRAEASLPPYGEGEAAAEGQARPDAGRVAGAEGNLRPAYVGSRLRRVLSAAGDLTPEGARNLGLSDADIEAVRARLEGREFNQEGGEKLGSIRFEDGAAVISMFKGANASTPIHEGGHLWLEELARDATGPNATERLKQDYQTVLDWFGVKSYDEIETVHHEQWARAFEAYVMEGKAPSIGLERVFRQFKAWLINIYRTVANLNTPISDEIRGVFDRMIATDEEIAAARDAQKLNPSLLQKLGSMTDAEWQAYQKSVETARARADETVLKKVMGEIRMRREAEWREERRGVREEVASQVNSQPVQRLLHYLRTGKTRDGMGDGERVKLDAEMLAEMFGGDHVLEDLPKSVPPIYGRDGMDPQIVAEMFGYTSAHDMVQDLLSHEQMRRDLRAQGDERSVRNYQIDEQTDQIMRERHGDMLTDGSIEREALDAVHNDSQAAVLAAELRYLQREASSVRQDGKRILTGDVTPLEVLRRWAFKTIAEKPVREATDVNRYLTDERKAGREVERALANSKREEAVAAKQRQLASHLLYIEAKKAQAQVEKDVRMMSKLGSQRTNKNMDQAYLDQIHALIERFDFRSSVTQKSLDKREALARWIDQQKESGYEVNVPDKLQDEAYRTHYTRMSVADLIDLGEAVRSIAKLGRMKKELILAKEAREFEAVKQQAIADTDHLPDRKVSDRREQEDDIVASIAANLIKVEELAVELANGKVDSPWMELFVHRPQEMANYRDEMRARVMEPIAKMYLSMDKAQRRHLDELITIPELIDRVTGKPSVMTRMELLVSFMHRGTQSNLDKLLKGEGWTEGALRVVHDRELTKADMDFAQKIVDQIGLLWPDIAKTEEIMSGVAPEKVDAKPIDTRHGSYAGGYVPVVYDPMRSNIGRKAAEQEADDLFGARSGINTPKGHTISRTDFADRMWLSLEAVLFRHVEKVIIRNAYAPMARDILKFIGDGDIRDVIERKLGPDYYAQIKPWLQAQVGNTMVDRRSLRGAEAFFRKARTNVSMVAMGFKYLIGFAQIAGLTNSAGLIGAKYTAIGLRKAVAGLFNGGRDNPLKFAMENSKHLPTRGENLSRDMAEMHARIAGKNGAITTMQAHSMVLIGFVDRYMVAVPTWLGAFQKAIDEGMSKEHASLYADGIVRRSQGGGDAKDLSAIHARKEELYRWATSFYTYGSVLANGLWKAGRLAKRGNKQEAIQLAFWFCVAAPLADALLKGNTPNQDDDAETWGAWAAENMFFNLFASVPYARDAGSALQAKIDKRPGQGAMTPITRITKSIMDLGQDVYDTTLGDGEPSHRWVKHTLDAPGYILGLPTGQAANSAQFLYDVAEGQQDPQTFWEWYRGVTTGYAKDKKK